MNTIRKYFYGEREALSVQGGMMKPYFPEPGPKGKISNLNSNHLWVKVKLLHSELLTANSWIGGFLFIFKKKQDVGNKLKKKVQAFQLKKKGIYMFKEAVD